MLPPLPHRSGSEGQIYHKFAELCARHRGSGILGLSGVAGNGNSQGFEEMQVLGCKGPVFVHFRSLTALAGFQSAGRLLLHLVQPDGRLQHQQNFKALSANIGDYARDLWGLRHTLVDGLAQLLNQLTEFLIQVRTSISRHAAWAPQLPILLPYLLMFPRGNAQPQQGSTARC
jgi:hypothetical protein